MRVAILLTAIYTVGIILNAQVVLPLFLLNVVAMSIDMC